MTVVCIDNMGLALTIGKQYNVSNSVDRISGMRNVVLVASV